MATEVKQRQLIITLIFVAAMMAVISSLGAPLINTVAADNRIPLSTSEWMLTSTLLTSAIATPIMGRLADGPRPRRVILFGLAIVIIGLVIAALSRNFPWLLTGRCLQGVGMGLTPVTMAIARNQLDAATSAKTIATLSVSTAASVGLGYPLTSLIAEKYDYHIAFWCAAVLLCISYIVAWVVIPKYANQHQRRFDVAGATLLTFALVGLLAVLGEGEIWGWASLRTIVIGAASVLLGVVWVRYSLQRQDALVNLRQSGSRSVITADVTAFLICISMYMFVPIVVEFVQIPRTRGIGFGASILTSGLLLVPMSLTTLAASRFIPLVMKHFNARVVIPFGCTMFAVATMYFAFQHTALWQAFVAVGIAGLGMGFTFAAMPGYIVRSVPAEETGAALGLYQLVRSIGLSMGSALAGTMLAHFTRRGESFPVVGGFTTVLYTATAILVLSAFASYFLLGDSNNAAPPTAKVVLIMKENAELGASALNLLED